tara:strand:+ start:5904 stop:7004 length:1101 start_codon:yes stop_codon:yes gene_type:complete
VGKVIKRVSEESSVLASLAFPLIVVNSDNFVSYVNIAFEHFLEKGKISIIGNSLEQIFNEHSPIISLVNQAKMSGYSVFEHDVDVSSRLGISTKASVHVSPLLDDKDKVVLVFHLHGAAKQMEKQLVHRGAARSVTAMGAMLAHEIKNPLAGIRGAAQLLESIVDTGDRGLAELIKEETDRICNLVDRMSVFGDDGPIRREETNIHEVLDRVQALAKAEFSDSIIFETKFDPSLPMILANKDQLIQVFLNLVKNSVEAISEENGKIIFETAFKRGVSFATLGSRKKVYIPLLVSVTDNGSGIPEDLQANLFDPFVSTKAGGTGLGLALVGKIVHDHGGVVEFDTDGNGTTFRLYFPIVDHSILEEV